SNGEYYIQVFNSDYQVAVNISYAVYLTILYRSTFNFENQADGSYLIYVKSNISTNCYMYVNGNSIQLTLSSSPANQTYYYLEYQPEGSFKIRVKSLDYYIARSDITLQVTNETYGQNGKFLIESTRPAWDIIFQIPTGSPYTIYQAFLYGKGQLMTNSCEVDTNGTCKYSFTRKNDILRDWWNGCLSVCKIKLSLVQDDMQWFHCVFDGVNTSPETWFVAEKLQKCIHYYNIGTNYSLTAAESGDWFFKITEKLTQKNVFSVYYANQTQPPYRKLTAQLFNNASKKHLKTE
ncbi:hypothetical protein ACJMK2_039493, partial [Sinanodonta woodiana]